MAPQNESEIFIDMDFQSVNILRTDENQCFAFGYKQRKTAIFRISFVFTKN